MTATLTRGTGLIVAVICAAALHLLVSGGPGAGRMAALIAGAVPESFADIRFTHAVLPRIAMGGLAGLALGLAGSLFQQITQNRLASPLTLGASSGAWLAMVIATLVAPAAAAAAKEWISLAGATAAFAIVVAIAGLRGLMGLQAVLAGMAVNLFLGAVAGAVILLESPYFTHLFVWGAGDLGQSGWEVTLWSLPRLLPAVAAALALSRVLGLLRTGAGGAEARGLALGPFLVLATAAALFLTATTVAAVGMIGFVGLLAPNLARMCGARRPLSELAASAGAGALLLLCADLVAVAASAHLRDLLPTGAAATLIGAPVLVVLLGRRLGAADHGVLELPPGRARMRPGTALALAAAMPLVMALALCLAPGTDSWRLAWPDPLPLSFRWPRVLAAAGAGAGMAVSGVILQRLIRNPLASPDILGMSSGATFALVGAALLGGGSIHAAGAGTAILGSLTVLALLLVLGRRFDYAPAVLALAGIALGATLDALVKFALASGSADSIAILGWLGGSTYRVTPAGAVAMSAAVILLTLMTLAGRRWLVLLGAGDAMARARGVAVGWVRPLCMVVAAILAAVVTAAMGPVAFIGLLAPHAAVMLGARRAGEQVLSAAALGAAIMVLSDWAGRTALHPMQLPAGTIAAIAGGAYFVLLLIRGRMRLPG